MTGRETGEASFDVHYDARASIIEVRMSGFWTMEIFDRYTAQIGVIIRRLSLHKHWFGIIVDNLEFPVQAAEVSAALIRAVNSGGDKGAPTALIATGALSRMQAGRIAAGSKVTQVVIDREGAIDWIAHHAPEGWKRP